jgi:hypothetical protein
MTVDDLAEITKYLQSMGYGQKQVIAAIRQGAAASLASDTFTGLIGETVVIEAAPLLSPGNLGTTEISYPLAPISDLDEAEEAEVRLARETAPTVGLVTSPCV